MEKNKKKSNDITDYHGSIGDVMSHVLQCTKRLTEAIQSSDEYRAYNEAKDAIKGNLELCKRLNEYRIQNFKLQDNVNVEDYFAELDKMEQQYKDIKKDPKVMAFLTAELRLCKMIQEINMAIVNLVDLELEF